MKEKEHCISFPFYILHFNLTHSCFFREWSTFMQKEFPIHCWPPALSPSTIVSAFPCCPPVEHLQGKFLHSIPSWYGYFLIPRTLILKIWLLQVLMLHYQQWIYFYHLQLPGNKRSYLPPARGDENCVCRRRKIIQTQTQTKGLCHQCLFIWVCTPILTK